MEYSTADKPVDPRFHAFNQSIRRWQVYSQYGEESILEAIFDRIGTANKWCCECGASDGLFFSNTRHLIEDGWASLQIEADPIASGRLIERYKDNDRVMIAPVMVKAHGDTFDVILKKAGAPVDLDLLVIDVDGQDYYLFNSLSEYQPRVVICEYDPTAERMFIPELNGPGQAGLDAIRYVGNARGYESVVATQSNVIFVRRDLAHLLESGITSQPGKANVKVGAVMSTPRLGFLANADCIIQAVAQFGIPLARGEGAWWQHSLTRGIEKQLEAGCDYILTIDYDSAFNSSDVAKLVVFLEDNPGVDVAVAMQQKREGGELLATSAGEVSLNAPGVPITVGHFGLTLFRRSVFERLSKPWFYERPDPKGSWNENRLDADMGFWENCQKSGVVVYLALDAVIGHLEQVVTWPGQDLKPYRQTMNAWRETGMKKPVSAFDRTQETVAAALDMGG